MMNKKVAWNGQVQPEAINVLSAEGGMIVCPTKVGYIIMTSDKEGWRENSKPNSETVINPAWYCAAVWNS